jgi:hypothetical protein
MLNPLGTDREYESERVDEVKKIDFNISEKLTVAINLYNLFNPMHNMPPILSLFTPKNISKQYDIIDEIFRLNFPVLNAYEISLFLDYFLDSDDVESRKIDYLGTAISRLVQLSYDSGISANEDNIFRLNTDTSRIHKFAEKLKGNRKEKIKIVITGDAGDYLGENSEYVDYFVTGKIGRKPLRNAKHSRCYVTNQTYMKLVTGDCNNNLSRLIPYNSLDEVLR